MFETAKRNRVAINCWVLRNKNPDGIGYFTINTISRLIQNHPEIDFMILCDKKFAETYFDFPNTKKYFIFPPYRHPVLYVFYLEVILPFFLRKHKPSLFLSMDGFLSLLSRTRQVPVIYDLNFEHFPKNLPFRNRVYYQFFFKRFARKSFRIVTISEYSKKDIVDFYKIPAGKIDNVSCGINSSFSRLPATSVRKVREKLSEGHPYFFFVGSIHPRKNVKRLILAFNHFKEVTQSAFKLVLAGKIMWNDPELKDTFEVSPYKDDIILAGRLSDEELALYLGAAYALTFVPVFEGFGLPLVEAMQAGVPILASNTTSLPEVAGKAAIYADPFSVGDIAAGMQVLYENKDDICNQLIAIGNEQKALFSWDRTARLLWNTVESAIATRD
jgi:glycosyltransferase involved in cell wall biosynthesis